MQKQQSKMALLALLLSIGACPAAGLAQTAVGLDTTGPQQVFGVQGISVGVWTTSGFNITTPFATTQAITAPAYYHSSDARLKTDIRPIDGALDKILALHGVEFNWKKDGRADMGVVAQNVAQVFPHVVTEGPHGMMAVEYDSLVGPMIESIRALKNENDDLRAEIKSIRADMKKLQQQKAPAQPVKAGEDVMTPADSLNP